jgi:hypothetical protein
VHDITYSLTWSATAALIPLMITRITNPASPSHTSRENVTVPSTSGTKPSILTQSPKARLAQTKTLMAL